MFVNQKCIIIISIKLYNLLIKTNTYHYATELGKCVFICMRSRDDNILKCISTECFRMI